LSSLSCCIVLPSPISFFFFFYSAHRLLHSFPTRRSSDLAFIELVNPRSSTVEPFGLVPFTKVFNATTCPLIPVLLFPISTCRFRSEEHTSELQSRFDLVCRLLLEKKNTIEYIVMCIISKM